MPELANAKWNEDTGKFEWADGRPFNADAIAKFSAARAILENGFGDVAGGAQGLAGAGREGHPLGRSTIKRVVLIGTVLRAASAEQREAVLSGLGTWVRGSSGSDGHGDGGAVSGQAGLNPDFKWLMYSRKEQTPFYSQLSKSIAEQPDRIFNQPAQSVATWLDANSGKLGIKKDELQWTGVLDWLRMQGKERVSKAQIDEFLQGNGVQVHETTLGGVNIDDIYEHLLTEDSYEQQGISIEHEGDAMYATYIRGQFDRMYQSSTAAAERVAELLEDDGSTAGAPKYASYQTPGGENYKELLLTLPEREPRNLNDISQEMFGKRFSELGDNDANAVTRAEREQKKSENFRSSHFDQPNILAHVRFNERTDADGNRVLFIEEIQSDFGQSYKKQRDAILSSVDNDFMGIVERMKKDGVLEVNCD
jgi:hypothetical protein